MADLRVVDIDDDLMARLKSGAALARVTLRDFVTTLLAEGLKRKEGRKRA